MRPTISSSQLRRDFGVITQKYKLVKSKKINKSRIVSKSRRIRAELLEESSYCFYCGVYFTLDTSTLDHCVPRSKGGKSGMNNVVISCYACNQGKADKIYIKRC